MGQIDTSRWKEFKLTELFTVSSGTKFDRRRVILTPEPHNINFIGRTGSLNGINAKCGTYKNTEPFSAGLLTVALGGTIGACFVQNKPFYTSQNVDVLIPLKCYVSKMTWNVKQFIASCIFYESQNNYLTFVRELNKHIKRDFVIKLPVTSSGQPDWQYMDTYIAKLTALAHKNVSSLKEAKAKPAKLNIDQWGEFKVSDWFDIRPSKYTKENGKALKNAELFDGGDNPVIVNSNTNNGIGGYTSKPLTEQGNVITYSDTTDGANTIFYQAKPFVGYSHVKVMLPKLKLSQATMIYLTSIIISAIKNQKYDFSYKLTTDKMLNTIIKLPIDANGEPDWEYMDNQVRHLATLSNLTITSLDPAKLPIFVGEWEECSVNKVFNVFTGAQVPRRYLINGSQERISVTNENNGVISKFDENELLKSSNARILTNFVSINFFGYAFYHKNKASLEMKVHAIQRKDNVSFSENQGLYIASLLNSQYAGKYGYGNQLSSGKLINKVIKLPVDLQGDPDWQYMDQYISWIKQYSKNKLTLIQ